VVGVPTLNSSRGAIEATAGSSRTVLTRSSFGLGTPTAGDRFGAALATLDADLDRCVDLAVGAPGADGTGAVFVLRGSPQGFTTGHRLSTGDVRLAGGDEFGAAVSGELGAVWVGAPGRDVGSAPDAGAVGWFALDAGRRGSSLFVDQGTQEDFPGSPEPGDGFGQVLSTSYRAFDGNEALGGVFVGVPREDIGTARDAGIVIQIMHTINFESPDVFHTSRSWTQNSPGMPGVAEAGDQLGAAVAEREDAPFFGSAAFGAPWEDIGSLQDAGLVTFLNAGFVGEFSETGQYWPGYAISQNSPGVPGAAESGDRFGASLATAGYRCRVDARGGYAIGSPGEDIGGLQDAGAVVLFDSGYNGTERDQAGPRDATC
jgi:hypothetical protein